MRIESIWMDLNPSPRERLRAEVTTDVAVIGGGITGVLLASHLCDAGFSVVLLEAHRIGCSNTGGSTGNLYATVSQGMAGLQNKWGSEGAQRAAAMRREAIDTIEALTERFALNCDFRRVPLWHCVERTSINELRQLDEEFEACERAGLAPCWAKPPADKLPVNLAMRLTDQAQFNPYRFTLGLAATLPARGVQVHEDSPVLEFDAHRGEVRTPEGKVRATHIVMATHTPLGFDLVQAEMEVFRETGIAVRTPMAVLPPGILWMKSNDRSLRHHLTDEGDWLIAVGETHRTGEPPSPIDPPRRLREDAEAWFPVEGKTVSWSAQQFRSADGLPYIGRSQFPSLHVATGFGADGLVWASVAAEVICGLVTGAVTDTHNWLSPRRFTPIKSASGWVSEGAHVITHLIGDRWRSAGAAEIASVPAGQGRIVDCGGQRLAVYRRPEGSVDILSPVCPHMRCLVSWNPHAQSWDCPCHGSRFAPDGRRIEGPALSDLERVEPQPPSNQ